MEFFKEKKEPVSYEDINRSTYNFKITEKKTLASSNQEDLLDFIQKLKLNIDFGLESTHENEDIHESNLHIGVAKDLKKSITLVQMAPEYKQALLTNYRDIKTYSFDDNEAQEEKEMTEFRLHKPPSNRKEKQQETFQNSIAAVNHESMHDVLKTYKHYQDDTTHQINLGETYFLNNKVEFLKSILRKIEMYLKTRSVDSSSSCDSSDKSGGFHPLIHQDVVKQYLNATSPYRGLLLFHGLGSGKTCTSIGIIEAMKQSNKRIFILTPASLRKNYQTQMMFCGSELFRKTENWEYVEYPTDETKMDFMIQVEKLTGLPQAYLKKRDGVFLIKKGSFGGEYDRSAIKDKEKELEQQIQMMIANRFEFISYNGISLKKWQTKYKKGNKLHNPFHNSTVIIDEGHNFVSRIFNALKVKRTVASTKLKETKTTVSTKIYDDLLIAENCNVVVLSGTPLINYPGELGVLFNMISGTDILIEIAITHENKGMRTEKKIMETLESLKMIDHVTFEGHSPKLKDHKYGLLKILKNPYGFVKHGEHGEIQYDFEHGAVFNHELKIQVEEHLKKAGYIVNHKYTKNITSHKRFPDDEGEFNRQYLPNGKLVNKELFQNKLVGYVSYIGDKRELMPSVIVPNEEDLESKLYKDLEIFIEEIPMTRYALQGYAYARSIEKEMDMANQKSSKSKDKQTSSYQIFSRSACNFVFPEKIERPYPKTKEKMNEDDLEDYNENEKVNLSDGRYELPDSTREEQVKKQEKNKRYKQLIQKALSALQQNPDKYFESAVPKLIRVPQDEEESSSLVQNVPNAETPLSSYSPKFERILQNIMNQDNRGLHLLYSNFRTLEGIGIFKMVLDYHGYTELKIKKENVGPSIRHKLAFDNPYYKHTDFAYDLTSTTRRKFYALYTGKEDEEDKEMIRNIFNGSLDKLPPSLRDDIVDRFYHGNYDKVGGTNKNNMYGELIQLLIISSSGAEGIDLKNVRFVHIMEPYWHPVRIEQVVGRARRICSHKDLPPSEQTVKVFMYLLIHNKMLLSGDYGSQFTGLKQVQDFDSKLKRAISTDERLYNIMMNKKVVMEEFLSCLKTTAIDCRVNYEDKSKCFSFKFKPPRIKETKKSTKINRGLVQTIKGVNANND